MTNFLTMSYDAAKLKINFDKVSCSFEIRNEFDSITLQDFDIKKIISIYNGIEKSRKVILFSIFTECLDKLSKFLDVDIVDNYNKNINSFSNLNKYFEEHRSYHNDTHVLYVLDIFEKYVKPLNFISELEKTIIKMALIWHDVEYIPKNSSKYQSSNLPSESNEEMSAYICRGVLKEYNIPDSAIDKICELIKCTTHYNPQEYNIDKLKSIICDIDLFRLSEPFDKFQEDRKLVRREYPKFNDEEWIEASKYFAAHFLKRNSIYTSHIFNSREQLARDNLSKLL